MSDEVNAVRRILIPSVLATLLAAASPAFVQPAFAQYDSNRALFDRIERLERDLQMMQAQSARGGMVITSPSAGGAVAPRAADTAPLPSGMAARLDDRVDQLEELVRQLTGKLEEANFKANQAVKQMERLQADIDLRFKDLQAAQPGGAQLAMPATGATTPSKGAETPGGAPGPQTLGTMPEKDMKKLLPTAQPAPAVAAPKTPQGVYDEAYAAAQRGDFASAERGFQEFLDKSPKHELAGNASYWLGDIAFNRKDYGAAAGTFLEAYKKYPKHGKAPDMIYKAGSAFGLMGKKKEACTAFTILYQDHPNMPDRVKRAAAAERQKYDCK
ncbi:tol-pal system protein YbgF [Magnetospirillum sp. UT-4]|uniref:tol-pal system protein YbgF n=1 Tax=Magnetospirillum sp. UT-4 TaxID=2681467 RepID=UPI00137E7F89|nr:tol-pal system protein YbgF [Magnetospirillum sp. UT-4]CAA7625652.1 Protein conserved in bacteria [Magnetospirillum sp. UT-4]